MKPSVKTRLCDAMELVADGVRYIDVIKMIWEINKPNQKFDNKYGRGYYATNMAFNGYLKRPSSRESRYLVKRGNRYFIEHGTLPERVKRPKSEIPVLRKENLNAALQVLKALNVQLQSGFGLTYKEICEIINLNKKCLRYFGDKIGHYKNYETIFKFLFKNDYVEKITVRPRLYIITEKGLAAINELQILTTIDKFRPVKAQHESQTDHGNVIMVDTIVEERKPVDTEIISFFDSEQNAVEQNERLLELYRKVKQEREIQNAQSQVTIDNLIAACDAVINATPVTLSQKIKEMSIIINTIKK